MKKVIVYTKDQLPQKFIDAGIDEIFSCGRYGFKFY